MANSMALTSIGFLRYGLVPSTTISRGRLEECIRRSSSGVLRIRAVQENEGPRRLVDNIRIIPDISRNYFRSPSRRALFGVLCVLITEYVTRFYYSRSKVTFPIAFLNNFKMGLLMVSSLMHLNLQVE